MSGVGVGINAGSSELCVRDGDDGLDSCVDDALVSGVVPVVDVSWLNVVVYCGIHVR